MAMERPRDLPKAERDQLLNQTMNLYGNEVYYIVFSYVKNHSLAEDLTQEVFIKCYNKMNTFREDSALKSWIISIAINHCKDHLRSWNNRMVSITHKINDMVKGTLGTPEETVIHNETNHELISKVLSLPIKYREVIFLHYFEEMKLDEICEVLHVNINTVKSRLSRGRKKIESLLKDEVYNNG